MLAGNPDFPGPKSVRLSAAGSNQVFTFDSTGFAYLNMGWVRKTWSFIANGPNTTIEFLSLSPASSSGGSTLDDVSLTDQTLGYLTTFGSGCPGTNGTPLLIPNQLPQVGQPMSAVLLHLPINSVGILVFGNGHRGSPSGVLPLSSFGVPDCTLYANLNLVSTAPPTGPFGAFVWGEVLPAQPAIAGSLFTMQFFFVDPSANAAGLSSTGGAIARVGV